MAQFFDSTQANDLLKKRYADKIGDLVPEGAIIQKRIPFAKAQQIGQFFSYSVQPTIENGFTYGGSGATAYQLASPIAGIVTEAQINGFEMTNRAQIAYGLIQKSLSGDAAYQNALDNRIKNLLKSHFKRQEISFRYGQSSLVTSTATNPSGGNVVITANSATFAGGMWAGMEGAEFDIVDNSNDTKLNTIGAMTLVSVDLDNGTLTFSGAAGDVTAVDAVAVVDVYFRNAPTYDGSNIINGWNEMIGINKIMTTSVGSLFNISVSSFRLWRGNTYSASSAPLSLLKITKALAVPQFCGLEDMTVLAVCSPQAWADLANDESALRRYPTAEKKGERGYDTLTFHYSGNKIEVIADPLIKRGDCFIFPVEETKRVGASDVKMQEISGKGEFYAPIPDRNGLEIRSYSNQSIFFTMPALTVKITNIVPST